MTASSFGFVVNPNDFIIPNREEQQSPARNKYTSLLLKMNLLAASERGIILENECFIRPKGRGIKPKQIKKRF